MAIIKHSCFALVLSALLSSVVQGQSGITFDVCKRQFDQRGTGDNNGNDESFTDGFEGSQRRTFGNLCEGSRRFVNINTDDANDNNNQGDDINSRIGDPFRKLCDMIERYPNVLALMATGNSPHTIFAPTDAAFAKVDGLIGRIDDQKVLEIHILPQARLTRDLHCGKTYRTINTNQDRRNNQRTKTRCINAYRSQQLGPGNLKNHLFPTVGVPENIFNAQQFKGQTNFVVKINFNENDNNNARETFSQDVISCNGVIHVVDEVILPGHVGFGPSQGGSGYYGGGKGGGGGYYGGGKGGSGGSIGYYGKGKGGGSSGYYGGGKGGGSIGYYGKGKGGGSGYYGNSKSYKGKSYKGKSGKGGKGSKGASYYGGYGGYGKGTGKGAYYGGGGGAEYYGYDYNRGLEGETSEEHFEAEADERYMSDAEFFGIDGLVESESELESVQEQERQKNEEMYVNRKRRLEALLEPNGEIAEAE